MPIYEYQCEACGEELEAFQKMSDAALTECPKCGKPTLTKLVSAAGFRLKGGGWYETDFKSSGQKNLAGDQAASSKKSSEGASSGSSSSSSSSSGSGSAA